METNAKLETVTALMKQEKEQLNEKLSMLREKSDEERQEYQRKILELKEGFEKRLLEHEKWNKRFEDEHGQLKDMIGLMKSEEKPSLKSSRKQRSPEVFGSEEGAGALRQFREMLFELKEARAETLESKALLEKEKELRELERKFLRQINDAKVLSENTLETVKKSFYTELQALKVKKRVGWDQRNVGVG